MLKTDFLGHSTIWGALPPNATPWLRAWLEIRWFLERS